MTDLKVYNPIDKNISFGLFMTFEKYWASLPRGGRGQFAASIGYNREHLQRVACGKVKCSAELALKIEKATYGAVKRQEAAPHLEW